MSACAAWLHLLCKCMGASVLGAVLTPAPIIAPAALTEAISALDQPAKELHSQASV